MLLWISAGFSKLLTFSGHKHTMNIFHHIVQNKSTENTEINLRLSPPVTWADLIDLRDNLLYRYIFFSSQSNFSHALIAKVTFQKNKNPTKTEILYSDLFLSMHARPWMYLRHPFCQVNSSYKYFKVQVSKYHKLTNPRYVNAKHGVRMKQADCVSYTQSKNHT